MSESKCIICNKETVDFFEKDFKDEFLGKCNFKICKNCGFVFNDTMYNMPDEKWIEINNHYHQQTWLQKESENFRHNPPYLQQALFFNILLKNQLIKKDKWLDYAAGQGILSNILKNYFNLKLIPYEKYTADSEGTILLQENPEIKFNVVFTSALFEHIRSLEPIEEMISLLDKDGVFMIHTLVAEKIPQDNSWFYLWYMHCSLFTNKAMQILMDKYNFSYSIYSPVAKTWVLFKTKPENIENRIKEINKVLGYRYLYGKAGFMDYWKN